MKISSNFLFDRATQQMGKVQAQLAKTQVRLSTTKQVVNPSDAPDQAAVIQRFKSIINRQEGYLDTLSSVQARLDNEESALSSVADLLVRAKEISLQAAGDTLGRTDRLALATELEGLRDQMLSLANTQDQSGNYIFSGSRVEAPAFAVPEGSVPGSSPVYQGDQTRMSVVIGDQRTLQLNRAGSEAFVRVVRTNAEGESQGAGFFQAMDDLIAGVRNSDRAVMVRGSNEMDQLLDGVLLAQADVGTDKNVLDQQVELIEANVLTLKTSLSNVEDLDYTEAITQMNKQMLSLQAAQSSFAKISQLNLFNYIS